MKKVINHFGETILKCIVCIIILKCLSKLFAFKNFAIDVSMVSAIVVLIQSDIIKFFNNNINNKRVLLIFIISCLSFILGMFILENDIDIFLIIEAIIFSIILLIFELLTKRGLKGKY